MWNIPLFNLDYTDQEKTIVNEVLNSGWLTLGEKTTEFENQFANYLHPDIYSCAVSSGTAALHMALMSLNLKENDEVLISGLSFVAALNVTILAGAKPVLVDSKSLQDWNVSVDDIKAKITGNTKALILVHYAGYPCDMDEITAICQQNNLILIEDAAHAVGASYDGNKCGTIGDIGCFSFFTNKNLSVGEGGMIVTKDENMHQKFRLLRSHGMTSMSIDRHKGRTISYDVVQPGLNYRIDEIRSALGLVQLSKLDKNNIKRGELARYYHKNLNNTNITVPWKVIPDTVQPSYHIFPVLVSEDTNRENFINYLKQQGIQTSLHYPAYNQFTHYKQVIRENVESANYISNHVVTLPLFPNLKHEEIDYIIESIDNYYEQL